MQKGTPNSNLTFDVNSLDEIDAMTSNMSKYISSTNASASKKPKNKQDSKTNQKILGVNSNILGVLSKIHEDLIDEQDTRIKQTPKSNCSCADIGIKFKKNAKLTLADLKALGLSGLLKEDEKKGDADWLTDWLMLAAAIVDILANAKDQYDKYKDRKNKRKKEQEEEKRRRAEDEERKRERQEGREQRRTRTYDRYGRYGGRGTGGRGSLGLPRYSTGGFSGADILDYSDFSRDRGYNRNGTRTPTRVYNRMPSGGMFNSSLKNGSFLPDAEIDFNMPDRTSNKTIGGKPGSALPQPKQLPNAINERMLKRSISTSITTRATAVEAMMIFTKMMSSGGMKLGGKLLTKFIPGVGIALLLYDAATAASDIYRAKTLADQAGANFGFWDGLKVGGESMLNSFFGTNQNTLNKYEQLAQEGPTGEINVKHIQVSAELKNMTTKELESYYDRVKNDPDIPLVERKALGDLVTTKLFKANDDAAIEKGWQNLDNAFDPFAGAGAGEGSAKSIKGMNKDKYMSKLRNYEYGTKKWEGPFKDKKNQMQVSEWGESIPMKQYLANKRYYDTTSENERLKSANTIVSGNIAAAEAKFPGFKDLDPDIRFLILDMQMGMGRYFWEPHQKIDENGKPVFKDGKPVMIGWDNFVNAIKSGNYKDAAEILERSKYAKDVGKNRAGAKVRLLKEYGNNSAKPITPAKAGFNDDDSNFLIKKLELKNKDNNVQNGPISSLNINNTNMITSMANTNGGKLSDCFTLTDNCLQFSHT